MNNSIKYKGTVSVKLKDSSLTANNTATAKMGSLIVKALVGYSVSKLVPSLLDIEYYIEGEWKSALHSRVPFTGNTYYEGYPEFQVNTYYSYDAQSGYYLLSVRPSDWGRAVYYYKNPDYTEDSPVTVPEYLPLQVLPNKALAKLELHSVILAEDKLGSFNLGKNARLSMYNSNNELLAYVTEFTSMQHTYTIKELYDQITVGTDALVQWQINFYDDKGE